MKDTGQTITLPTNIVVCVCVCVCVCGCECVLPEVEALPIWQHREGSTQRSFSTDQHDPENTHISVFWLFVTFMIICSSFKQMLIFFAIISLSYNLKPRTIQDDVSGNGS